MDSLADLLEEEKTFTLFELFIVELIKKFFEQLRYEAPAQNLDVLENNDCQYHNRWNLKRLLSSKNNQTVLMITSLQKTLQKAHNWLK